MATTARKTECPVSRSEFLEQASSLPVTVAGIAHTAEPKQFSTGSLGWNVSVKQTVVIGGKRCTVQVCLNATLVGSKDAD